MSLQTQKSILQPIEVSKGAEKFLNEEPKDKQMMLVLWFNLFDGRWRARTADILGVNETLYQLS